jgi:DNA-binding phage protein
VCAIFLASSHVSAALVDAVSVVVDNEPVTIYEIYALSKQFNMQTREALDILIREKLELSQIKAMNIQVSDYDINQQMNEIAAKNNLSVQAFYKALSNEGITSDTYKAELKRKMQQEKLYQYVLSSKFQAANEDEFLLYYNKNKKEFTRFESFDVVRFESQNAQDLEDISVKSKNSEESTQADIKQIQDNAMQIDESASIDINEQDNVYDANTHDGNIVVKLSNDSLHENIMSDKSLSKKDSFTISSENVMVFSENISSLDSDPKIINMLSQTNIDAITPIIQTRDGFVRFFMEAKNNESILPYEQVKNFIMTKISSKQENDILKEYFDTLKSRATITIIRLP